MNRLLRAHIGLCDRSVGERASRLEMVARQVGEEELAGAVAAWPAKRWWMASWVARWWPLDECRIAEWYRSELSALIRGWPGGVVVAEVDGRFVVVSGRDRAIRLWGLVDGQPIGEPIVGHDAEVTAMAVAGFDGWPVVVSAAGDMTLRAWGLGMRRHRREPLFCGGAIVRSLVTVIINGWPVVVSGADDGALRVWDVAEWRPRGEPMYAHRGGIRALVAEELEGRPVVVSVGEEGWVRAWT